jgi:nucleoid-associated protein YgaU
MKKCIFGLTIIFGLCFVVSAIATDNDSRFVSNPPDSYVVKKDDTLWDISGRFLKHPWYWPEIWHVNKQIANPHLIFPGDVIRLVYIDGNKRLTVDRPLKSSPGSGTTKLEPQIYSTPVDKAIAAIPLDEINSFLSKSRFVEEGEFESAPYVLAGTKQRLILGTGDSLYARGKFANDIANYGIYRKGETYLDPETKEVLGIQVTDIGSGNMQSLKDEIATLNVTRAVKEVRVNDRLMPNEERFIESTFFPSPPTEKVEGVIMAVEGGVAKVGMLNVVVLNRGKRENLNVGHVLAIYKRGEIVKDRIADEDVALPEERAGLLMVFQSFDKLSLALVMEADRALSVNDIVRNP